MNTARRSEDLTVQMVLFAFQLFFTHRWTALADAGVCDAPGGLDHLRVSDLWSKSKYPGDVDAFIRLLANERPTNPPTSAEGQ